METTIETKIIPLPPYDFELTAGQPGYSRDQEFKTEDYVAGAYIRLLDLGDKSPWHRCVPAARRTIPNCP